MGPKCAPDLEAYPGRDRWWQGLDPAFRLDAKPDRALGRAQGIIACRLRQPEQNHGAIAKEARDQAAVSDRLLVDQGMKPLQKFANGVWLSSFAERRKAREIDENDGRVLPDGLEQKVGIPGEPFLEVR